MKVADLPIDPKIIQIVQQHGIQELYPPQADALPIAVQGKNVVVAVPTAAGKSLVAYLPIIQAAYKYKKKSLYIVPLRALAREKWEDLQQFKELGIKIGIATGDLDETGAYLAKNDIIVCTSEKAVSLYIISENIVFDEESIQEHRIDDKNLKQIEKDFTKKKFFTGKKVLFPISWFRADIGLRSFETLDLWNEIKDDPELQKAFNYYDRYISGYIYKKFKPEEIKDLNLTREAFLALSPRQRTKVMKDLIVAIRELTRLYKEG